MRYDDEDIEIIDIFEDVKKVSHIGPKEGKKEKTNKIKTIKKIETSKPNKEKKRPKKEFPKEEPKNKFLFISIVFIPIFFLMYVISKHSTELINKRISIFSLVMIVILTILLLFGLIKEIKLKRKLYKRILKLFLSTVYVSCFGITVFFLYGDNTELRDFIIDKAMSTTNHQYIATWLYDSKTIGESLAELKEATKIEINGSDKLNFDEINYNQPIYENEYEEAILSKENEDDIYKIINIEGKTIGSNHKYKGYLVAIYDPSKVKLGVSKGAGTTDSSYGQILSTISKNNKALVAINAGGFYDPYWRSNGGIPHGAVIKDGQILSEFRRGDVSGGLIGFNYNNELVLKRMTAEEAIYSGIRDAVDWGPYLIVNGKNQYSHINYGTWATSRTVIGQRKDGIVLFLVIDGGKQPGSYGASYADAAKIMERYGAVNAANLDGGTSTALVENHQYVNNPWNGSKRTIRSLPNAWIVVE